MNAAALPAPSPSPSRGQRMTATARLGGLATMGVAGFALLGWLLDVDLLRTVLPGHAAMKANTAIGLLLAGLALVAATLARPGARVASLAASTAVLVIGTATLVQYIAQVDLGIDTALFDDPDALAAGKPPGRMSQISAVSFVLLGWKGLRNGTEVRPWMGQALALAIVIIALFALSAYGYAMGTGSREAPFNPISLHTAVLLLVLGLGWLALRPEQGLLHVLVAESFGGELARLTLLPALLAPALLAYLAQLALNLGLLSEGATITLLAVSSGAAVAAMIWWASNLLDRVERQRQAAREARDSAHTDALTGLGNRRAFDEAISALVSRRAGGGPTFSLLLLDLDHFKAYNDSFGHPAGDEALRQAGRLLPLALRPGDVATRYGGEEFALLLPGAPRDAALGVAQRIAADLRASLWLHRPVTASLGVAEAGIGETAESVIARADAALYAAKQAGRDRAVAAPAQSPGE